MRLRALVILLVLPACPAPGTERFPPPDFTSHVLPTTTQPPPRLAFMEYVDLGVLALAIGLATWFALRRRSRWGVFGVMAACLAYFGFYRGGCVCPIGAIQNVALAVFDSSYSIPLGVLGFFLIPVAATLVFGRTFCAGVCPLGAIQDLVAFKPLRVPAWLAHSLGLLAWVYLGLAVLLAATGSMFAICEYDPFVGFFRLSGPWRMIVLGTALLAVGVFVARPYCRFLCPLGALFRPLSRLSRFHVSITPDKCIQCRLCEDSCPFGAINGPNAEQLPADRRVGMGNLVAMLAAAGLLIAGLGVLGYFVSPALARAHVTVRLANQIRQEAPTIQHMEELQAQGLDRQAVEAGGRQFAAANGWRMPSEEPTDPGLVFRKSGRSRGELYAEADRVLGRFAVGGTILGAMLGLIAGGKLVSLSLRRRRTDYTADRATCLSCGRCFEHCPMDRQRRKRIKQGLL